MAQQQECRHAIPLQCGTYKHSVAIIQTGASNCRHVARATRKDYALSIATPLPPRNNATKVAIDYFRFFAAEWNTRQAVGYFRSRSRDVSGRKSL